MNERERIETMLEVYKRRFQRSANRNSLFQMHYYNEEIQKLEERLNDLQTQTRHLQGSRSGKQEE